MPTYYQLSQDEIDIIKAIRKGEAKVVLVPRSDRPKVGDITQYDERIVMVYSDGSFLVSSKMDEEEVEEYLKNGAKRVRI